MQAQAYLPQYATHLPLLAACVAHTTGPVLEVGMGTFSTPVLHAMCAERGGRALCSLESDPAWYQEYIHYATEWHRLFLVSSWAEAEIERAWDVALVDHTPPIRRVVDIARLRPWARLIVVHDTENRCYAYEPLLTTFKYRVEWQGYSPWTSVVSDVDPLDWLKPICEV